MAKLVVILEEFGCVVGLPRVLFIVLDEDWLGAWTLGHVKVKGLRDLTH